MPYLWETGVYGILNISNGHMYIGSTSSRFGFRHRFRRHTVGLRNGNHHSRFLQRAWDKYGQDSFEFTILERCAPARCLIAEQMWLDLFRTYQADQGYNLAKIAGNCLGVTHSEETRLKISAASKGKKKSLRMRIALSRSLKGRKYTPETIQKMRDAARVREAKRSPEQRIARMEKMNEANRLARRKRYQEAIAAILD